MTLIAAIAFIGILAIIILVHEWGHFIVARRSGARVDEFGFGFPPRLFGIRRGETLYSLNLIPLGGFVKIYGEEGEGLDDPRSFAAKSAGTRTRILLAGVTMNFLLAVILFIFLHLFGIPTPVAQGDNLDVYRNIEIRVVNVAPDSPAQEAGFEIGDAIRSLGIREEGVSLAPESIEDIQSFVRANSGRMIEFNIMRGREGRIVEVLARENPPEGEGPVGFAMERIGIRHYPIVQAIIRGIEMTVRIGFLIVMSFVHLIRNFISGAPSAGYITGPVGIFVLTRQFAQLGFIYIIQFTALISLTLAILNAVPYPALDGGQLLFILIEKIKGSPISERTRRWANIFGFASLMVLIALISIRDVQRFF